MAGDESTGQARSQRGRGGPVRERGMPRGRGAGGQRIVVTQEHIQAYLDAYQAVKALFDARFTPDVIRSAGQQGRVLNGAKQQLEKRIAALTYGRAIVLFSDFRLFQHMSTALQNIYTSTKKAAVGKQYATLLASADDAMEVISELEKPALAVSQDSLRRSSGRPQAQQASQLASSFSADPARKLKPSKRQQAEAQAKEKEQSQSANKGSRDSAPALSASARRPDSPDKSTIPKTALVKPVLSAQKTETSQNERKKERAALDRDLAPEGEQDKAGKKPPLPPKPQVNKTVSVLGSSDAATSSRGDHPALAKHKQEEADKRAATQANREKTQAHKTWLNSQSFPQRNLAAILLLAFITTLGIALPFIGVPALLALIPAIAAVGLALPVLAVLNGVMLGLAAVAVFRLVDFVSGGLNLEFGFAEGMKNHKSQPAITWIIDHGGNITLVATVFVSTLMVALLIPPLLAAVAPAAVSVALVGALATVGMAPVIAAFAVAGLCAAVSLGVVALVNWKAGGETGSRGGAQFSQDIDVEQELGSDATGIVDLNTRGSVPSTEIPNNTAETPKPLEGTPAANTTTTPVADKTAAPPPPLR